jgi:hypothetical protein
MQSLVRYQGTWQVIAPKPFEPERQTSDVAWSQIKGIPLLDAYKQWYARERELQQHLYPK